MNVQKIYNVLADDEATKPELRAVLQEAELILQKDDIPGPEIQLIAAGFQSRFTCDYDSIRQKCIDLTLQFIQKIIPFHKTQLFYTIYKTLFTTNLKFDAFIKSETSRQSILTILLKLIIYLEKQNFNEVQVFLQQQQKPIVEILTKQFCDTCPENRIQVCKCIFRFSKLYKHLLTEDEVNILSKTIVNNFNHQRFAVRQLSMQAFTQLHLCAQSKEINKYFGPLLTFLLHDDKNTEILIDAAYILLKEHIDRHVYADIFAIPLIANLQYSEEVYNKFVEIGEIYLKENCKYDKFLQIQKEMQESNINVQQQMNINNQYIKQFNKQYYNCDYFTQQLNTGCRVICFMTLNKNVQALLNDLKGVQQEQLSKISQLMVNLILINQTYIIKFTQQLVSQLALQIHDLFNQQHFARIILLVQKFLKFDDLHQFVSQQICGNLQSVQSLVRIYKFAESYIRLMFQDLQLMTDQDQISTQISQLNQFITLIFNDTANFLEDTNFSIILLKICLVVTENALQLNNNNVFKDKLQSLLQNQVLIVSIASVLQRCQGLINTHYYQLHTVFQEEYNIQLQNAEQIVGQLKQYIVNCQLYFNYSNILQIIQLSKDLQSESNLVLKIQIFSQFLFLTQETGFQQKHSIQLIQLIIKLLKIAQNHEKSDKNTRYYSLTCVKVIITNLSVDFDQKLFILRLLFEASTWKHAIRSPECMVAALQCQGLLLQQMTQLQTNQLEQQQTNLKVPHLDLNTLDDLLAKICVNLEHDQLVIRQEILNLCQSFIQYFTQNNQFNYKESINFPPRKIDESKLNEQQKQQMLQLRKDGFAEKQQMYDFDELQFNLVQRVDDSKTVITLKSLELFGQVTKLTGCIKNQQFNIINLLLIHLNDQVVEIRQKCWDLVNKFKMIFSREEVRQNVRGKLFEYYNIAELFEFTTEEIKPFTKEEIEQQNKKEEKQEVDNTELIESMQNQQQ